MNELTDAQIDAALARGKAARLHEPRAATARYDRARERVVVELTNGCTFAFPPRLAQGLGVRPKTSSTRLRYWVVALACTGKRSMSISRCPTCWSACSAPRPTWPAALAKPARPPKPPPPAPMAPRAAGHASQPDTLSIIMDRKASEGASLVTGALWVRPAPRIWKACYYKYVCIHTLRQSHRQSHNVVYDKCLP